MQLSESERDASVAAWLGQQQRERMLHNIIRLSRAALEDDTKAYPARVETALALLYWEVNA